MYAIRSYYDSPAAYTVLSVIKTMCSLVTASFDTAVSLNNISVKMNRITSYNVCYTKLLRFDIDLDEGYDLLGNTVTVPVVKAVSERILQIWNNSKTPKQIIGESSSITISETNNCQIEITA